MENSSFVFVLIYNIPKNLHASDLRIHFSDYVESDMFSMFHFRHRPESKLPIVVNTACGNEKVSKNDTLCSIIKLTDNCVTDFYKLYNESFWTNCSGEIQNYKCFLKVLGNIDNFLELNKLPELNPPPYMPRGNVGTPTCLFLSYINKCQLPTSIISKLDLNFLKLRNLRKYSCIPFDYGNTEIFLPSESNFYPLRKTFQSTKQEVSTEAENDDLDDGEETEEWERHEALHDDVTSQDRLKERLYEKEIELVWEKGGSGLVFYTDAQYWNNDEGDFDSQTADDWDIDTGIYYQEDGGDKDISDFIEMHTMELLKSGQITKNVFCKSSPNKISRKKIGKHKINNASCSAYAQKILHRQGWRKGLGLGKYSQGISEPLEDNGQSPFEKKGLGYYGEALSRIVHKKPQKCHYISTKYDNVNMPDQILRRQELTYNKMRCDYV